MTSLFKKVISLLNLSQKKRFILLIGLMLIGMALETLGIGLIIPLFSLITEENFITKYQNLTIFFTKLYPPNWFLDTSEIKHEHETLIIVSVFLIAFLYLFKSLFLIFLSWIQANFIKDLHKKLASKLFLGYLNLPYSFYLQKNSAHLFRNIQQLTPFIHGVDSFMILLAEVFVVLGISLLLFITKPIEAVILLTFISTLGFIVHFATKNRLTEWGRLRNLHLGEITKHAMQGFGAVKDIKMFGGEKNFLERFDVHNEVSLRVNRNGTVVQTVKRSWLELIVIFGMSILLLFIISQSNSYVNVIPTLGLFTVAAFRLMPSVNRIIFASHRISLDFAVVSMLHEEFTKTIQQKKISDEKVISSFNNILEVDKVYFTYKERDKLILSNINLKIQRGMQIGFVGESGSGKSTLMDVIIGLLKPFKGTVKVDGNDIQYGLKSWSKQIGYVPQNIYLTDDTLRNNIAFALKEEEIDDEVVKEAITGADLEEFVNNLPEGLNTAVGEKGVRISGGQKQRVGIARALYHKPAVLIFDEATSSLDVETEKEIMNGVNKFKGNKTVIIVSHRLSAVSNCDQVFTLDKGKIF